MTTLNKSDIDELKAVQKILSRLPADFDTGFIIARSRNRKINIAQVNGDMLSLINCAICKLRKTGLIEKILEDK